MLQNLSGCGHPVSIIVDFIPEKIFENISHVEPRIGTAPVPLSSPL